MAAKSAGDMAARGVGGAMRGRASLLLLLLGAFGVGAQDNACTWCGGGKDCSQPWCLYWKDAKKRKKLGWAYCDVGAPSASCPGKPRYAPADPVPLSWSGTDPHPRDGMPVPGRRGAIKCGE